MIEAVGQYKLLERIGAGSLGEVYRARDTKHGRTVAVRILDPQAAADPETRARFLHDGRTAARLSHPNIAAVYEANEEGGVVYLASEYVAGNTLATVLAGRAINQRRAVDLAAQIADALADAHSEGLAHLDLRSDKVVMTPRGGAKVLDFGLAARHAHNRAAGEPPDFHEDIFALGVMLYEMLTGRAPCPAGHGADGSNGGRSVRAPSEVNRSVTGEIDAIVARLLSADPAARYGSAAVAASDLRAISAALGGGDAAAPALEAVVRGRKRTAVAWTIAVLSLAAILALLWLATRA
jgi:serine/threonine-protein kinase